MTSEQTGRGVGSRGSRGGFTLVELLVASALGATAVALVLTTFLSLSYAASGSIAQAQMSRTLRHVANIMSRDLLSAKRIISYNPSSYVYYTRKTPAGDTSIFFSKSGDRIMRWETGNYQMVAGGVDSVAFTLYDQDGAVTTSVNDASSLDIKLRAVTSFVRQHYEDELSTRVFLRNCQL